MHIRKRYHVLFNNFGVQFILFPILWQLLCWNGCRPRRLDACLWLCHMWLGLGSAVPPSERRHMSDAQQLAFYHIQTSDHIPRNPGEKTGTAHQLASEPSQKIAQHVCVPTDNGHHGPSELDSEAGRQGHLHRPQLRVSGLIRLRPCAATEASETNRQFFFCYLQ